MKTPLDASREIERMHALLHNLRGRQNEMVRMLERFVAVESPSHDKEAVDRLGATVAAEWRKRHAQVRVLKQPKAGSHVRAELPPSRTQAAAKSYLLGPLPRGTASAVPNTAAESEVSTPEGSKGQILVLGHLDTVYPLGTIEQMPFRVAAGKAFGPGTFDMKAGLVMALFAVEALRAVGLTPRKKLVFLWTSDEETGSRTSRSAIEKEARRSAAVLVLEPSFGPRGALKTARKGVGTGEIIVHGRAAHAGIDPGAGVNAVHELALQIERLMELNDPQRGTTVQATVIEGGTASNVVPENARAQVDIRFARPMDGRRIEKTLRALRPILKGARIEVRGGVNRPPLERTARVRQLFSQAQSLMRALELRLDETATGGGSDGNFTAALGVPTLDGLGAIGDGAHSAHEHVVIRSLSERAALLAGLLATL